MAMMDARAVFSESWMLLSNWLNDPRSTPVFESLPPERDLRKRDICATHLLAEPPQDPEAIFEHDFLRHEFRLSELLLATFADYWHAHNTSHSKAQHMCQLFYLHELDHAIKQRLTSLNYVRIHRAQAVQYAIDYDADATAISVLHALLCHWSAYADARTSSDRLAGLIEAAIASLEVFAFASGASNRDRIDTGRFNRLLIWHFQRARALSMPSDADVDPLDLFEEPRIEAARRLPGSADWQSLASTAEITRDDLRSEAVLRLNVYLPKARLHAHAIDADRSIGPRLASAIFDHDLTEGHHAFWPLFDSYPELVGRTRTHSNVASVWDSRSESNFVPTNRALISWIDANERSAGNFVHDNSLIQRASRIDLMLYTAETIVTLWRNPLQLLPGTTRLRLCVRRPERDAYKQHTAEGCLATLREIMASNRELDLDVHYYDDAPLLRMQHYYLASGDSTLLVGVYRFDPSHAARYVGAERNGLFVVNSATVFDRLLQETIGSRFSHEWERTSPLRAVAFDMDGVLVDTMSAHCDSWLAAFRHCKVDPPKDDFTREIYQREGEKGDVTASELYRKYTGSPPKGQVQARIMSRKNEVYRDITASISPIDGVLETLHLLKSRGVPLAVVTGTDRSCALPIIHNLFPNMFQAVITGSDSREGKPSPTPYVRALQGLGVLKPEHCVCIENAPLGVQSGHAARLRVYGLLERSPLHESELLARGAKKVFLSHAALRDELASLTFKTLCFA